MQQPNMIITYDPTHALKAKEEVEDLMKKEGRFEFLESGFEGVFLLSTVESPKKIIRMMNFICDNEPHRFRYTYRWTPVDVWCGSSMPELKQSIRLLDNKMDPEKSWAMDIGKRGYDGDTVSLVTMLTEEMTKPKVDLKKPDVIVKVEIVGDHAGLALVHKDDLLNVTSKKL